jgi:exopolyphosphatase/guanosine-5'-triphosphate,3'-diphosphate pyrophosphatase
MYSEFLDEGDWMRARKLSLLLAVAEALDTTQMQLVRRVKAGFDLENGLALLELELREAAVIEQENVNKLKKAFKKEFNLELTVMA